MLTTSVVNFHRYLFCICHEREWCTQLSTCYSFQFSPKTSQTMPLYDYLTPKLDFKRKFNHRQSFLYKGRLTVRTIQKFRIGSSLRIESRIGSSIQNRISKLRRSLVWRPQCVHTCVCRHHLHNQVTHQPQNKIRKATTTDNSTVLYTVQHTVHVHCTMYCTLYCTLYHILYMYTVQCTVRCNVQCTTLYITLHFLYMYKKNTNASRRQEFFRRWTVSLELSACCITWQRHLTCTV